MIQDYYADLDELFGEIKAETKKGKIDELLSEADEIVPHNSTENLHLSHIIFFFVMVKL